MAGNNRFDLFRAMGGFDGIYAVKAGVLEEATNTETGEKVAPYAAYNEFGTSRTPSRPFMRNTVDAKEQAWISGLGRLLETRAPEEAMRMLGQRMADDIVATIAGDMPPPNAESTRRRKRKEVGGGRPGESQTPGTLVDTGSLINSINFETLGPDR